MMDSTAMRESLKSLKLLPGIFGSPQPSQVKPGSMPGHPRSRQNAGDELSRFIKIIPAFAYDPYGGKTRAQRTRGRVKSRRLESAERAELALLKIRNRKPTNSVRSRLS